MELVCVLTENPNLQKKKIFFLKIGIFFLQNWEKSYLNSFGNEVEFRPLSTQKKSRTSKNNFLKIGIFFLQNWEKSYLNSIGNGAEPNFGP